MRTDSLKESVVASYGRLAKSTQHSVFSKLFSCCNPKDTVNQVSEIIGYSREEIDAVPEGANLGVGCGNPSALSKVKLGQTVIDLGSGAGFDTFLAAPLVGENGKVIGIDLSDDMLELARKNANKGNYSNVEFLKGDIEDLPIGDEVADHVISNCVINLSLRKGKVYKEAFRVLKNGGKLAISDIILEQELPDFVKESLAGHIACISGAEKLEDYLQYVEEAGFQAIKVESKKNFPLELMLTDPQVVKIALEMNFDLSSEEARDIASRVSSISLSATK